jgi:hypothetical protein
MAETAPSLPIEGIYTQYCDFVAAVVRSGDLSKFKSHPAYTPVLEHVTREQVHSNRLEFRHL